MGRHEIENDQPGDLGPLIESLREEVPADAAWDEARDRLLARLAAERAVVRPREGLGGSGLRRRPWRWAVVGGFAAAIALAATLAALVSHRGPDVPPHAAVGPVAQVEMVQGECRRIGPEGEAAGLSEGDPICAGDCVRVGVDSDLRLKTTDGSSLWLCPDTEAVCVGPRSNTAPAVRLVRGEIRADVTRRPDEVFHIDTPAAALRVLGTEFHVRVLPELGQQIRTGGDAMTDPRSAVNKALMVLTVLSGAVAVDAAGEEQIVKAGELTVVASGAAPGHPAKVENPQYVREWLAKRLRTRQPTAPREALVEVVVRPQAVQSLLAIDVRSGKWRRVGDFVGSGMGVLEHVAPDLAIVGVSSPLYNWSVEYPVGGHENPLSGNAVYLVDLVSGERLRLRPLDFYAVLRPSLSPDRRLLAFDGYDHHAKKSGAFVLNIETLQVKPLPFHAVNFSWSSDSRWVATARWENKQPPEVVLIDAITGQIRKTAFRGTLPRFTPNGRQLAFQTTLTKTWPHRPASLSIADFPDGKPKEVLHLQDAHLEEYSFSPDGNRVLYWQSPVGQYQDYGTKSLHDLDLRSGKSRPILTLQLAGAGFPRVQWLDENSQFLLSVIQYDVSWLDYAAHTIPIYQRSFTGPTEIKRIDLSGATPQIRHIDLPAGAVEPEGVVAQTMADRVAFAFTYFDASTRAEHLYVFDEARLQYSRARDLLTSVLGRLESGKEGSSSLRLPADDVRAYCDFFAKVAAADRTERSFRTVRDNLQIAMPWVLSRYYCGFTSLPLGFEGRVTRDVLKRSPAPHRLDLEACAKEAPGKWWGAASGTLHLDGSDIPLVRRLFLVPGDDPDKVMTSFQVVRPDKGDGVLVIRTPVLANGRRLEATYRIKEKLRTSSGDEDVRVSAEVVEAK